MLRGFVTALRTLTILPIPGKETDRMADALSWFPVVGCLLAGILWALASGLHHLTGGWNEGSAAVVLSASAILTRGLHLDGLADWADGFGGGNSREATLTIMKDPRAGAFGVVALVLVLVAKWAAFSRLIEIGAFHWVIPAIVVSRMAMVELAVCLPYARSEGGTAAPFVNGARTSHRFISLITSLVLVLVWGGMAGVILMAAGWAACRILGLWFRRRVGGLTGDLLGACSELIETGLLVSGAAVNRWLV